MNVQSVETTVYSLSDCAPPPPPVSAPASERREGERLLTLYRVGSLQIGDRRDLCLIKNISAGGMMIRAQSSIAEGTALSVELKSGEPITSRATWVSGANVGIAFDDPIDVLGILSGSLNGPRPRMPRIEVDTFMMVREGASLHRLRARDISQGGIKVDCKHPIAGNSDVIISIPGIERRAAVVKWSSDTQMGIAFNRVLTLSVLIDWLREQRAATA